MATVLLVEDSPTDQHHYKTVLEKSGYQVEALDDGSRCLDRARELKPDVILMDVVMPGMNGFEATRQLARDSGTSEIPVIMITTKDQETDKVWGMRQGARDYLTKPVDDKALVKAIRSVMGN